MMEINEFFKSNFENIKSDKEYKVAEYASHFFVGIDKDDNIVIVLKPNIQNRRPYNISTKALSLECNAKVSFSDSIPETVHILKCLLKTTKEKTIFLELSKLFISDDYSDKYVIETFNTLQNFFSNKKELSDNELTGFYAELYTIYKFHDSLQIEKFWQSKDRLKFDFSISEKIKLEIKATTKDLRIHHFLHEQLNSTYFDIYVLSYLFRYDDEGLSLYDLIEKVRPILINEKEKFMRLTYIEKNTSKERLQDFKYNQIYTDENMRLYKAENIPKFREQTPAGVSKAEYDCALDNVNPISFDEFKKHFLNKENI